MKRKKENGKRLLQEKKNRKIKIYIVYPPSNLKNGNNNKQKNTKLDYLLIMVD